MTLSQFYALLSQMLVALQVDLEEIRNRSRLEDLLGVEKRRIASAITNALSKNQCDVCTCKCAVYHTMRNRSFVCK